MYRFFVYFTLVALAASLSLPGCKDVKDLDRRVDEKTKQLGRKLVEKVDEELDKPSGKDKPAAPPVQPAAPAGAGAVSVNPTFTLAAPTVEVGESPVIRFNAPLVPLEGERYWITLIPSREPDPSWGKWAYVESGATEVKLAAPTEAGDYEIRLHGNYPAKPYNVVFRVSLKVVASGPGVSAGEESTRAMESCRLERTAIQVGQAPRVFFGAPLVPVVGEQYWITLIRAGAGDGEWGDWKYVDSGATEVTLAVPTSPGDYEVRLHGNYPTKSYNVVCRQSLQVVGK